MDDRSRYAHFDAAMAVDRRKAEAFGACRAGVHLAYGPVMEDRDFAPLKARTKAFGVTILGLVKTLPTDPATAHIVGQLVRCATSVGSNYRASCRAKSKADFISKMAWVEEEADESKYWLEVLVETGTVARTNVAMLIDEADQLVRIVVASINTARGGSR
jgi:four helix bundle protein